jgi:hypothetical protein
MVITEELENNRELAQRCIAFKQGPIKIVWLTSPRRSTNLNLRARVTPRRCLRSKDGARQR